MPCNYHINNGIFISMKHCLECDNDVKNFLYHVTHEHMSYDEYVIKHFYNNVRPLCKCGCGLETTFYKGKFRTYVKSHAHNDQAIRQRMIDAGREAANDVDKRRKNAQAIKALWMTDEYRQKLEHNKKNINRIDAARQAFKDPAFISKMRILKQELWKDQEWAKKQRQLFNSTEYKSNVSVRTKEALSHVDIKEKMSDIAKCNYKKGKVKPKTRWQNVKCGYYVDPSSNDLIWLDSNWEYVFLVACFELNIKATKQHDITIQYNYDNNEHTYFPDFYLPELKMIVEVKGQLTDVDLIKHAVAENYLSKIGIKFFVIMTGNKSEIVKLLRKIIDEK